MKMLTSSIVISLSIPWSCNGLFYVMFSVYSQIPAYRFLFKVFRIAVFFCKFVFKSLPIFKCFNFFWQFSFHAILLLMAFSAYFIYQYFKDSSYQPVWSHFPSVAMTVSFFVALSFTASSEVGY